MRYSHTHVSAHDGSPAMLVSQTADTITLINEDGFEWADPLDHWKPVDKDGAFLDRVEDIRSVFYRHGRKKKEKA